MIPRQADPGSGFQPFHRVPGPRRCTPAVFRRRGLNRLTPTITCVRIC